MLHRHREFRRSWNDRDASENELDAALEYWRRWHSTGSRRRLNAALANWRKWHPDGFAQLFEVVR